MLSITLIKPRNKNWYAWLFFQAWQKGLQFTFLEKGKKRKEISGKLKENRQAYHLFKN
jgi:hypothetical protein